MEAAKQGHEGVCNAFLEHVSSVVLLKLFVARYHIEDQILGMSTVNVHCHCVSLPKLDFQHVPY